MNHSSFIFLLMVVCTGCSAPLPDDVAEAYDTLPDKVDYNIHVKPILSDKCFSCHGPDKANQEAGLRLDIAEIAYAELPETPGKVAIKPGNLNASELFHRIMAADPDYRMPPRQSHLTLSPEEKAILVKWIKDGAEYQPHWAFVKPEKPTPPKVRNKDWSAHNEIDNFILDRLHREGLQPSAEADKEVLLRRLSLDLTGLPPVLEEIETFLQDQSPDAYEKQVDRLLRSPHYGERMAMDWLDVARFADSYGYTVDRIRDMSPYRDWVIKAFNQNLPYDQFVHWQLAGDMMPNATKDMIIATAFNRNHQQNMEGGIIEEEFKTEYVMDRTNTLGDAFLGITVSCARCHDHKFDPVTQKNYFELYSFFNNIPEAGQISWDNTPPAPTLLLPTEEQEAILRFIDAHVAESERQVKQAIAHANTDFEHWLASGTYKKLKEMTVPKEGLQARYTFDQKSLNGGVLKIEAGNAKTLPTFVKRGAGLALAFDGDTWLDFNQVGIFRRSQPFSVGIDVFIPSGMKEGVILHKSYGERHFNFKGYHLYLKNGKIEMGMAHAAPGNAIIKISRDTIPRDRWVQMTLTYDGSSRAAGLRFFLDGKAVAMDTQRDNLYKDIIFTGGMPQYGLQIGGWARGLGLKDGLADNISVYDRALTPYEVTVLAGKTTWKPIADKDRSRLTDAEINVLKTYYLSTADPNVLAANKQLEHWRTRQADSVEALKELMVMQEMDTPQQAYVLDRGVYDAPTEKVYPNTPASILPFPKDLPKNRYGLAQWLTHEDNPLTARVAVNRMWQNLFGTGLVKTAEDFGNQGEMPSHKELLDWLAVMFRESGWDVKKLMKTMVMSATYRQHSYTSPELRDRDPENRLLARGPSYRLPAEMIRDNALLASGLLNHSIGGKSVKPYQPPGLWEINNTTYVPDTGDVLYRRSLYVMIKRSVPHPTLSTFDATSRSYCIVRRQKTNTPLQALVMLNDPTFVEASRAMGEEMTKIADARQAITQAYRRLTSRHPAREELDLLMNLQAAERRKFATDPNKSQGWLTLGQHRSSKKLDASLLAANTVVASTILNSDAALTKR
ncbi:DUF1553 domain-containing protein [Parapedobacter indicus]|uniref:Concanavalin A-like lectin/glucanases superfamily protein n=1 Tax=Parapedobacter indicus TaxID=1477437 RepID=A0A1I3J031_9SPHI|nr:DUF1553 domain-containing protein [Parapedobacter indicus]PPL02344.1 concanavalin A-like lectin/glucanase superfamily protein [Parapedobacter indicus]SFI53328.1 Concanavalin A-like lectin/glucanases superfamily protein [Parapedobacter indicus]